MSRFYFADKYKGAFFLSSVIFFVSFFFTSCFKDEAYEKQIKSLDSLSGALNQKLTEFRQVDTVVLQKAILKYNNYKQFIQQSINDTVNKTEANTLQQFYAGGNNLVSFSTNRLSILARGSLLNSQINKLIADAKASALDLEKLKQYTSDEKKQADELIKNSFSQQELFQSSLQEFKLSLQSVEELMKVRNNGQLPTIIKDSIPL